MSLLKITFNFFKMLNKNQKSQKKSTIKKVFSENQVMTLLENMNDGIEIIAENQNGLRGEFNEFRDDMTDFRKEQLGFNQQIENNFREVFDRLDSLSFEVADIKNKLNKIDKTKIDRSEFADALKRIQKIEKELEKQKKERVKSLV